MPTTLQKDEAHKIIEKMPQNATWNDLIREIYVRQTIEQGLEDSNPGRTRMFGKCVRNTDCINESPLDKNS